jgi:hypothetical protein
VRWAAIEAISGYRGGPKLKADYERIAERRGKYRARVAVARKLLTLVYYGLRDGEIRCLTKAACETPWVSWRLQTLERLEPWKPNETPRSGIRLR